MIGATTAFPYSDNNSTFGMTRPGFGAHVKKLQQQKGHQTGMALSQVICRGNSNASAAVGYRKGHRYNPQGSIQVKTAGRARVADSLLCGAYTMVEDMYGSAIISLDAEGHYSLSSPSLCMTRPLRQYF